MTIQDCLRVCKRTIFPVRVTPVAAQRTEVNAVDDDAAPELDDGETSIGVQGALDVAVDHTEDLRTPRMEMPPTVTV